MERMELAANMARVASRVLAGTSLEVRNTALERIALALEENAVQIFEANRLDLAKGEENGLAKPILKRLTFDEKKLADVVDGIRSLIKLPDPMGRTMLARELAEGMNLYRVSCPIGVIGVIFESRPDALVQIATLCLKSGNAVLLKGGSEAAATNRILADVIYNASRNTDNTVPKGWMELMETREDVSQMLKMDQCIDLIIPRGSNEFVRYIMQNTNIEVLGHADGVCHTYVDKSADLNMALQVVTDAKTQYVSVCNATETVLVHRDIAHRFLPMLKEKMDAVGVELYSDDRVREWIETQPITEWHTEYLDYKLSVKIADSVNEAVQHINQYGSKHTEAIITADRQAAEYFMQFVDAGSVFWNCSTRFSDGFKYGFGAEVGISTSKIHARGPVGLEGLMSYKYLLYGQGQIVADFAAKKAEFTHRDLEGGCPLYEEE